MDGPGKNGLGRNPGTRPSGSGQGEGSENFPPLGSNRTESASPRPPRTFAGAARQAGAPPDFAPNAPSRAAAIPQPGRTSQPPANTWANVAGSRRPPRMNPAATSFHPAGSSARGVASGSSTGPRGPASAATITSATIGARSPEAMAPSRAPGTTATASSAAGTGGGASATTNVAQSAPRAPTAANTPSIAGTGRGSPSPSATARFHQEAPQARSSRVIEIPDTEARRAFLRRRELYHELMRDAPRDPTEAGRYALRVVRQRRAEEQRQAEAREREEEWGADPLQTRADEAGRVRGRGNGDLLSFEDGSAPAGRGRREERAAAEARRQGEEDLMSFAEDAEDAERLVFRGRNGRGRGGGAAEEPSLLD